jgi:hypothetical protein
MAEEAKKAAPKRKTTARKTTARKTTAKRKPAARKAAPRKTAARKKAPSLQSRVTEAGRSAFLASLGFYGMAFDQMQEQYKNVESELAARRKKADKLYADMVKRGEEGREEGQERHRRYRAAEAGCPRSGSRQARSPAREGQGPLRGAQGFRRLQGRCLNTQPGSLSPTWGCFGGHIVAPFFWPRFSSARLAYAPGRPACGARRAPP